MTIGATGDLLVHAQVAAVAHAGGARVGAAYDFTGMLAPVRRLLQKPDLMVCHLETPVSADDRHISGYPDFDVPRELIPAVRWAGWDTCSTASNHTMDQGPAGVTATLDVLDANGIAHTGSARSAAEAARIELHRVGGATIGLLAYTYGINVGHRVPAGQPWRVNLIDVPRILADARRAKRAGADFVVVELHWGTEYVVAPTAEQRRVARALLASPYVDLLLGGHAHVVQPIEKIDGKYVVYGRGNFLSRQSSICCPPATQDGIVVTTTVTRTAAGWRASGVSYVPTMVERGSYVVLPAAETLEDPRTPAALRVELRASWRRTVAAVTLDGRFPDIRPDRAPPA